MGKIKMNKKGIFFTFIAITMMIVFIILFTQQPDLSLTRNSNGVLVRISSIDDYIDDLEKSYLKTALQTSSYKAIFSLIEYEKGGAYLADFNESFFEVASNGTIEDPYGSGIHVLIDTITGKKIMENSTMENWTKSISDTASSTFNINTTIKINNITALQSNPWEIDITLDANITVASNVAKWKKRSMIQTSIPIEGLSDPYFLVNTNGAYDNKIKKSSVIFNQWNISKAREHLRNGTYVHWQNSQAPSFIMRFTNSINPSECCGIESLVNPNKLAIPDNIESYTDYLFWTSAYSSRCIELYNITYPGGNPPYTGGLWDEFQYFKMDFDSLVRYNISQDSQNDALRTC
ncbi:MAG TPA: hypothetical protein VJI97_00170 [Candidatus Nanoarchaeia archaeon]|nr:hypothetical protein [Candidatus Nanoarchaeia archaeon]